MHTRRRGRTTNGVVYCIHHAVAASADLSRYECTRPHRYVAAESNNGPAKEFSPGSQFVWQAAEVCPQVGGVDVDIKGRWPLFQVSPELPKGLRLDATSGIISGAPEEECEGEWLVSVTNPVGTSEATLRMRVMSAPQDYKYPDYDFGKAVLERGVAIGEILCQVRGSGPLRFMPEGGANGLPAGVSVDDKTGTLSGTPDQTDADFVKYTLLVGNDVGFAILLCVFVCVKRILCVYV